jgi:hypothetical protein
MAQRRARPQVRGHKDAPRAAGIERQAPPQKLAALTFEHGRLLKAIGAKQKDHARLDQDIRETARRLVEVEPIRDEILTVERQIHRLFHQLLARKGQPRKVRRAIGLVYDMLQEQGVLSPDEAMWDDPDAGLDDPPESDDGERFGEPRPGAAARGEDSPGRREPPPPGAGGFSARRPSDGEADQSLRGLFRRLALAVHPDRVSDDAEKVRRTEAMKEISRAYEERDLARLLHLERAWMGAGILDPHGTEDDALARKLAHLERMNHDLRVQLAELTQAIRKLRRSPAGQMHLDLRRAARETQRSAGGRGEVDLLSNLVSEARTALAGLRELLDFAISYRDGGLTLDAFMRGPGASKAKSGGDGSRNPRTRAGGGRRENLDLFAEEAAKDSRRTSPRGRATERGPTDDEVLRMMEELLADMTEAAEEILPRSRPSGSSRKRRDGTPAGAGAAGSRGTGRPARGRRSPTNDDIPF